MQEQKSYYLEVHAHDGGGESGGASFGYVPEDTVTKAIKAVREVVKAEEAAK